MQHVLLNNEKPMENPEVKLTLKRGYRNNSSLAHAYIHPLTQKKRDMVSAYLKQWQEEDGIIVTDPENTFKRLMFTVGHVGNAGFVTYRQFLVLTWKDIENLILYHLEDYGFCFNRLLYRDSALYMAIDNKLIHRVGRPYLVSIPRVQFAARVIRHQMIKLSAFRRSISSSVPDVKDRN